MTEKTAAGLEAVQADIFRQTDELEAELSRLLPEARTVALAAAQGDAEAVKRHGELNTKIGAVRGQISLLAAAADEASEKIAAARGEEARRAAATRREEAGAVARELLVQSQRADAAFAELAAALAERRRLVLAINKAEVLPSGMRNRLYAPEPVMRAAAAAALDRHGLVPRGEARHRSPLAAADAGILGSLPMEGLADEGRKRRKAA